MTKQAKRTKWIIGIDEVGRGPLAGPVMVCALAIMKNHLNKINVQSLTDSKKMTQKKREEWYKKAKEMEKENILKIILSSASAQTIDKKGINKAIAMCIKKTLIALQIEPEETMVLLDGTLVAPNQYIHQKTIIRGDQSQKVISLASVVAKVSRDKYMVQKAKFFGSFGWAQNKGYGTKEHIKAIKKEGLTPLHRRSFLKNIPENLLDKS